MIFRVVPIIIVLTLYLSGIVKGQTLIKNINTCQTGSNIQFLQSSGEYVVFEANTFEYGEEIYISDGTPEGTNILADLTPGPASTSIWEAELLGDSLYVISYHLNASEAKVWCINIETGVSKNILTYSVSGLSSSAHGYFTRVDSLVFFILRNQNYQFELWETDGSVANTQKASLLPNNSFPKELTAFEGMVYFTLEDGAEGHALWSYNGFYASQVFNPDHQGYYDGVSNLTVFDSSLFFIAIDTTHGYEIWESDGTASGTSPFTNFDEDATFRSGFSHLTVFKEELYFLAREDSSTTTLWVTNGPADSIKIVTNTKVDEGFSYLNDLAFTENYLAFLRRANDDVEIWISDGSSIGTSKIIEVPITYSTIEIEEYDGMLYFNGIDTLNGIELWKSDGSMDGTALVRDIEIGARGSNPSSLTMVNNGITFISENCEYGQELWFSDGTESGTGIVKDLKISEKGSSPSRTMVLGDKLIFNASTDNFGNELYVSDGTSEGTFMLADIHVGVGSSYPSDFVHLNGKLYFLARTANFSYHIYVTDGTIEGTNQVSPERAQNNLIAFNGYLYADIFTLEYGTELWKSDGTEEGTSIVKDINPGNSSSHPSFYSSAIYNNELYFSAHDGIHGQELWKTDGTEEGTVLVKFIDYAHTSPNSHYRHLGWFITFGDYLYFTADDPNRGRELWRTDGTSQGTVMVKDIWPGSPSGYIRLLGADEDFFYLSGWNYLGIELWRSDGTEDGTTIVKDINPGSNGSYPGFFYELGEKFIFSASTDLLGNELYISDGTSAGTELLKDVYQGPSHSYPRDFGIYGDIILFNADDGANGRELWKTDGTAEGTRLLLKVGGPSIDGYPSYITTLNDEVYLTLNDTIIGRELWKLSGLCLSPLHRDIDLSSLAGSTSSAERSVHVVGDLEDTMFFQIQAGESISIEPTATIGVGNTFILNIDQCNE